MQWSFSFCWSALEGIILSIPACKSLNVYTCFYFPHLHPFDFVQPMKFDIYLVWEKTKYYVASHKFWKLINLAFWGVESILQNSSKMHATMLHACYSKYNKRPIFISSVVLRIVFLSGSTNQVWLSVFTATKTFSVSVLQWWEAAPFKLTLPCDDKLCTLLCLVSVCVYMCGGTLEMEDDTHWGEGKVEPDHK